jgi:hypothetical protein
MRSARVYGEEMVSDFASMARLPSHERNRVLHQAQKILRESCSVTEAAAVCAGLMPDRMTIVSAKEECQSPRYRDETWIDKKGPELEVVFDGLPFILHERDWYSPTGEY